MSKGVWDRALTNPSSIVCQTARCRWATKSAIPFLPEHNGVPLAACTSWIILRIVSSSYGRVEDFEVMKSMVPMSASFFEIPTLDQWTHRRNHALRSPWARHKRQVEDDGHQKWLERVTNDSYSHNVDPYITNPVDDKPTNKGTPNGALHTTFSENSKKVWMWKV